MLLYADVVFVKMVVQGVPMGFFRTLVRGVTRGRRGYVKVRDFADLEVASINAGGAFAYKCVFAPSPAVGVGNILVQIYC